MTKKIDSMLKERTLLPMKLQIRRSQSTEDFVKSFKMSVKVLTIYDYIVQEDKTRFVGQPTENQVHQSLKDRRCASQPERHHLVSKATATSNESCLMFIRILYGNVMASRTKNQRSIPNGTIHRTLRQVSI